MKKFIASLILACALDGSAGSQVLDLPPGIPETATASILCQKGRLMVLNVVFTYAGGKVVRIDAKNMHGIPTAVALMNYAQTAKDFFPYVLPCASDVANQSSAGSDSL